VRAVVVVGVVAALLAPVEAGAHHRRGPCALHWQRAWREDGDLRPVRRLIRCATRIWPVPGGARRALGIARCESGFRPDAYGWGNAGVFQHRVVYWPERALRWLRPAWFGGVRVPSPYNARANVIVAVRMAHSGGWGPWACA